jgi:hypothetical protein
MVIRESRRRFTRRIVAFALFVLIALSYVAATLVVAPTAQDAGLALQSAIVLRLHEAQKPGAATVTAPSAPAATSPTRHGHQS